MARNTAGRLHGIAARAGWLWARLLVKAAGYCHAVCVFRYAADMFQLAASDRMRVLIVEDEPLMADAIRDGLRLEAIAADIAGDGDSARAHHRPPGQEIDGLRLDLAPRGPPRRPLRRA